MKVGLPHIVRDLQVLENRVIWYQVRYPQLCQWSILVPLFDSLHIKYRLKSIKLHFFQWIVERLLLGIHSLTVTSSEQQLLWKLFRLGINLNFVDLVHVICQLGHPIEAEMAALNATLVPLLIEVSALMLDLVTAGREPPVAMLTLVWFLAGMTPHMQLEIGHAAEYPATYFSGCTWATSWIFLAVKTGSGRAATESLYIVVRESRHNAADLGAIVKKWESVRRNMQWKNVFSDQIDCMRVLVMSLCFLLTHWQPHTICPSVFNIFWAFCKNYYIL